MYDPTEHEPRGPGFGPGGELIYQKSWLGHGGDYFAGMGYDYESFGRAYSNSVSFRPTEAGYRYDDPNGWMTWKTENITSDDIEFTAVPVFTSGKGMETRLVQIMYFEGDSYISSEYFNRASNDGAISGDYLFNKAYAHFHFGGRHSLTVDASSLHLGKASQKDLVFNPKKGTYSLDLYKVNPVNQTSLALGKISLYDVGDNQFSVFPDYYDFNIEWENGFSKRNIATAGAALGHYNATSLIFGGPFWIIFRGTVTINP